MTYLKKEKLDRVKAIIEDLQSKAPYSSVTKKKVDDVIKEEHQKQHLDHILAIKSQLENQGNMKKCPKREMEYKTVERAFGVMLKNGTLVQEHRGQYWLPEYHANCVKNLKRIGDFESIKEVTIHILDALKYCKSDEDWKLLEAFFTKMNENKRERAHVEYYEAEQREDRNS
jgi:hypothetical protein